MTLSKTEKKVIEDEELFLEKAANAIKAAQGQVRRREDFYGQLEDLREELSIGKSDDAPALFQQYNILKSRAEQVREEVYPDLATPYFAHMRLEEGKTTRDVYLGHNTFIDTDKRITIIDWKNAPLARIFFTYQQGEEYEEELPGGRIINGVLADRRTLSVVNGELRAIQLSTTMLLKDEEGQWEKAGGSKLPQLKGGQGVAGQKFVTSGQGEWLLPEVTAMLDPQQYELMEAESDSPMLVNGGAGSGKTTVAMHRLATLAHRDPEKYAPRNIGVIVPEIGLVKLSKRILERLGLTGVHVVTFDEYVLNLKKRVFKNLPKAICKDTPLSVSTFKRNPAMLKAVQEYVESLKDGIGDRLIHAIGQTGLKARFERIRSVSLNDWLDQAIGMIPTAMVAQGDVKQAIAEERERLWDFNADREELFGNRHWLNIVLKYAGGNITNSTINDVMEHTRAQMRPDSSELYAHIDPEQLKTADGRSIDEDTPDEVANTIDVEDITVLLCLLKLKMGQIQPQKGKLKVLSHLFIDEAQELTAPELMVLGEAVEDKGQFTIAGDAAQQIDQSAYFQGWDSQLQALGLLDVHAVELTITYRCPRPIAEYAHKILGDMAPPNMPKAVREGMPVSLSSFGNFAHMSIFLSDALADLLNREPRATIAIIARTEEYAENMFASLKHLPNVRLVKNGDFDFQPGVDVTDVASVKGLEFDYVIIPDANINAYQGSDVDRRMMHVASTRAIHQLWLLAVGKSPEWLKP